jgi:hypothetical protein
MRKEKAQPGNAFRADVIKLRQTSASGAMNKSVVNKLSRWVHF